MSLNINILYKCLLTDRIMLFPVVDPDGDTCEREEHENKFKEDNPNANSIECDKFSNNLIRE